MTALKSKAPLKINAKRWAAYAAAGAVTAIAGAETAEADITHVVVGSPAGDINLGDDKYFALTGGVSINQFNFATAGSGGRARVAIYGGGFNGSIAGFTSVFPYASNLAAGVNVSTQNFLASVFATLAYGSGYTNSQFLGTGGFYAFQFDAGGGTQYGWARISSAGGIPTNNFVVEEYAFADVGESIAVGQTTAIPEPTSLGLLALGAIGLVASRRRREQK